MVSRHGVPTEVLSDRGRAFLSSLMKEVEALLGFYKVNTSAYHPQTDGLVERFNRTLIAMLEKTVEGLGSSSPIRPLCLPCESSGIYPGITLFLALWEGPKASN